MVPERGAGFFGSQPQPQGSLGTGPTMTTWGWFGGRKLGLLPFVMSGFYFYFYSYWVVLNIHTQLIRYCEEALKNKTTQLSIVFLAETAISAWPCAPLLTAAVRGRPVAQLRVVGSSAPRAPLDGLLARPRWRVGGIGTMQPRARAGIFPQTPVLFFCVGGDDALARSGLLPLVMLFGVGRSAGKHTLLPDTPEMAGM